MAHYKSNQRSTSAKLRIKDVLPIDPKPHTDITDFLFKSLMAKLGVTNLKTYLQQLRVAIAICVVACTAAGGYFYDLQGFLWGLLAGLAAPAGLLWFGIVVSYVVVYVTVLLIVWAVLFYGFFWLIKF